LYALKNNRLQQNIVMAFSVCPSTFSRYYPPFLQAFLIALKPYAPRLEAKELAPTPNLLQQTLIIDGKERPVEQRKPWAQEEDYSGKYHSQKAPRDKKCYPCNAYRLHRAAARIKIFSRPRFSRHTIGIQKEREKAGLPEKKPKGKELTEEQKLYNHNHASIIKRVILERVIASIKTLRVLNCLNRGLRRFQGLSYVDWQASFKTGSIRMCGKGIPPVNQIFISIHG
jgi:hypothetical protein